MDMQVLQPASGEQPRHDPNSLQAQIPHFMPPELDERQRSTKRQRELEWFDVSCLIINKMIGTGLFVNSAIVVHLSGSKWLAFVMWILGSFYSFARYFSIIIGIR